MRRLTEDKMETASLMNGSEYTYKNGLKLLDKWICENCGQVFETDLRVCEACGWVESTSIPNEKEIEIMDKMKMNGKFVAHVATKPPKKRQEKLLQDLYGKGKIIKEEDKTYYCTKKETYELINPPEGYEPFDIDEKDNGYKGVSRRVRQ